MNSYTHNIYDVNISHVISQKGLSLNTVRTIAVDGDGFIWAGTLDGLNRYDGYNIRSYLHLIDKQNNISDHRIRKLFTDSKGDLWVRTYKNEICYYDKTNDSFIYIKDEDNELLCFENITESSCGHIWLWKGEDRVMCLKRNGAGSFEKKTYANEIEGVENISFLHCDVNNNTWIGTDAGLYQITYFGDIKKYDGNDFHFNHTVEFNDKVYFSTDNSAIISYNILSEVFEEKETPFKSDIKDLIHLSDGRLFIITETSGIWEFDTLNNSFTESPLTVDKDNFAEAKSVRDNNDGVWFYNPYGIIWYFDHTNQKVIKLNLANEFMNGKTDLARQPFEIPEILIDSEGLCWMVTYGYGVFCYKPMTGELICYQGKSDQNAPASDYFLSITEDGYGNIWIGSEYSGLIKVVKSQEYINIVRPEEGNAIGKHNNVRTIFEDSQNNVWIGLKNGGLYIYDAQLKDKRLIKNIYNPYSVVEDNKQRVWIASKGEGVYLYDLKTHQLINHFKHQASNLSSLGDDNAFHIIRDSKDRVWIATFGNGLSLVEENNGNITFRNFLTNRGNRSLIRYLHQDTNGLIWAATSDGLICFDPDKIINHPNAYLLYRMSLYRDDSLSSNDIKTIYQDDKGTIWVGTAGGGLNKFVEADGDRSAHFIAFTTNEGLPDNYVLGILEYKDDLWLSTESGLTRFNKTDYSTETYQFAQMSYGNIFNEGAKLMLRNGEMTWGTLDGLLLFDPAKFNPDANAAPVLLTGLQIDGVDLQEVESVATKSIGYTNEIKLNHKQNTLHIEFATLNLRNSERNQYSYILENFDKEWSKPDHINTATYKNLPPGNYVFKVKGANSYGIWNEEITSFAIKIAPPFWKSIWAYIIYLLFLVALLIIIFRIILKFDRLNNAIEMEKQLTHHKLRFFTNISHEFRTPLTLIQGAIENLNDSGQLTDKAAKQLKVLNRNSMNLRRLIDQLLEFRKIQNDVLRLDLESADIIEFTHDIFSSFQELAEQKKINYSFASSVDNLSLFIDRKKLDKIIYNLLSNAFKFTPREGSVELRVDADEKRKLCIITVTDSGIGIPKEKKHLLFTRFSQINEVNSGTGVGLSLVKDFIDVHKGKISFEDNPNETGSVFKIELSTLKETYSGENFISSTSNEVIEKKMNLLQKENEVQFAKLDKDTLKNYNLLIIDDNDDIRSFLTDGFNNYLNVDTAADGKEGLEKAINTNPDLIICDVMMPEMDGFEVVKQIKGNFQTCHIPVILLTAHSSSEHQFEGIESGADDYITKPFSLKYVQKRVLKMIEQREQLKKRFSKGLVIEGNLMPSTDKNKEFFDMIEAILEENYKDSDFTIDKFVELSKIKRTIFYKKVKGVTGFSPNELIKIKRMNKSALLLKEGDMIVSEVAYAVGFEDPFYFSKCFKTHFNCTPTEYRKGVIPETQENQID